MESIYYVMCWACHRRCKHCYDDRFRPYVRGALDDVVSEATTHAARIVDNLPDEMTYRVRKPDGTLSGPKTGRIILAGGEPLVSPVREKVLYPTLDRLAGKYAGGKAHIVLQTTGDLLTEDILADLKERGVHHVSCAGFDEFHVGMEEHRRHELVAKLHAMFAATGYTRVGEGAPQPVAGRIADRDGPFYSFMGAQPDSWIGELWPRGRAWSNDLSTAGMKTNFCARQSGAWRFLDTEYDGSEVAIEPDGKLYPCCLKTKRPIGDVSEEPLLDILDRLRGHPVFEALNDGRPDLMGESLGWSPDDMAAASRTVTPRGRPYENLCIGCDKFFDEVMGEVLAGLK